MDIVLFGSEMEVPKEIPMITSSEMEIMNSVESFKRLIESQKDLVHNQIDQLQRIVTTQCTLTGVNPLSQEMAAGALSIKIGKRPRDLLNPKAVKYMQSVFSIKDTISKKESREISALCGVTVTQVRDFFAGQRSRVRKLVRIPKEKTIRSNACDLSQDECTTSSNLVMPINQVPLNSFDPKTVEEVPSLSSQEETLPGIDKSDKHFVENIFNLMEKEDTFSGKMKLLEWIMQMQNSLVLYWFLSKGGLMIIATWLGQAALEEQTTVLLVIFKALCHLPLHKALPIQMSAILQAVNKLRFYRTSDISNRARILLSRWSKLFVRSQALKKPVSVKNPSDTQNEMMWKQRIGENLGNESLQLNSEIPEILALTLENSENCRKLEPSQTLKLLPASTDDSNRKQIRTGSSPQTKERRKVRLMEQPGQRMAGRSSQVARTMATTSQSRPLSADDIQKAKIRAMHLQSKYGKTSSPSYESRLQKTEKPIKFLTSQKSNLLSVHEILRPRIEEDREPSVLASKTSLLKAHNDPELSLNPCGSSMDMLKRGQIPWQKPPEMRINSLWGIATGEKSKEVEIQTQRIRREKETRYHRIHEIPYNPKEPWDREMDYDDTLTPIIPSQQQPEPDGADKLPSPRYIQNSAEASSTTSVPTSNENATSQANISSENVPEPDFELLAVLLKNPELVFALTSARGNNFSSEDTVKLLEMIKGSGFGLNGLLNASSSGKSPEKMEITSLPSPTPSTSIMSEWRPEVAHFPAVSTTSQLPEKFPATNLGFSQNPTFNNFTLPQVPSLVTQSSHQLPARMNQQPMQTFPAMQLPEKVSFGDIHNVKPAKVSIVLNPPKRPTVTLPQFPGLLRSPARPPQLSPSPPLYPSWTNNYNVFPRGPGQPQVRPGRAWEGNEFANEPEFESWSPENSPVMSPEYRYRRNFVEPRRGSGRNSRPDWSRQRNFSEQRDHRGGNRRWRDRRR